MVGRGTMAMMRSYDVQCSVSLPVRISQSTEPLINSNPQVELYGITDLALVHA